MPESWRKSSNMKQELINRFLSFPPISLMDILDAKETRVANQNRIMDKGEGTLISFTLNIAGNIKACPLFSMAFQEGKKQILSQLRYQGVKILFLEEYHHKTGDELYVLTNGDIITVKKRMVEIEENFSFGRLFDIDVMNRATPKISRSDLGLPPRQCLVCEERAAVCARSQRHSIQQIQKATVEMIAGYFLKESWSYIARTACKALLYEVNTAPKPGLVDRENNGSHKDMDTFSFIDSACSLYPYFERCTCQGAMQEDLAFSFDNLRYLGKEAENRMLEATGGINTHKGAIFSMGIFCAAAGKKAQQEFFCQAFGEKDFQGNALSWEAITRNMCSYLMEDFQGLEGKDLSQLTHGEKLYLEYGISGIRGEAAQGFPSVLKVGLPVFRENLAKGKSINDAAVAALMTLIEQVEDTNILIRSDRETLLWAQKRAAEVLRAGCKMESVRNLNEEFIQKNISPGGCADLLALCFFVYFIENHTEI